MLSESQQEWLEIVKMLVEVNPNAMHARSKDRLFSSSLPIQYAIQKRGPATLVACLALLDTEQSWMFLVQQDKVAHYVAAVLEQAGGVDMVRKLADARDKDGRNALDVASATNRDLIENIILYLGRYQIDRDIYTSPTSTIHVVRDRRQQIAVGNAGVQRIDPKAKRTTLQVEPEYLALKVMSDATAFKRELAFHRQLDAAFVVPLVRWHAEHCTLAMVKAERSLEEAIAGGCFSGDNPAAVHDIALQVARSIEHVHRMNVVHADIKPRNILSCAGQWKLADFDSATQINEYLNSSSKVSTGYCAPELAAWFLGPKEPLQVLNAKLADARVALSDLARATPPPGRGRLAGYISQQMRLNSIHDLEQDVALRTQMEEGSDETGGEGVLASVKIDEWSFGVVLFQLIVGTKLFAMDTQDRLSAADVRKLLHWSGLPGTDVEKLRLAFQGAKHNGRPCPLVLRASAISFLRSFLRRSPTERPQNMSRAISHSFLTAENAPRGKVLICSAPEEGLDPETGKFDFPVMKKIQEMCSEYGDHYVVA
jgi:serine/threonine protein kinase